MLDWLSYVALLMFSRPQLCSTPPNTSARSVNAGTVGHSARSGGGQWNTYHHARTPSMSDTPPGQGQSVSDTPCHRASNVRHSISSGDCHQVRHATKSGDRFCQTRHRVRRQSVSDTPPSQKMVCIRHATRSGDGQCQTLCLISRRSVSDTAHGRLTVSVRQRQVSVGHSARSGDGQCHTDP